MKDPIQGSDEFWSKFGWWVSGVWLFFLIFPVLDLIQNPHPLTVRVIGLSLLVIYAGVYLRGYRRHSKSVGYGGSTATEARVYFGIMALIVVVSIPVLESGTLGLLPFLSSYAAFLLGRRFTYATYSAVAVLAIALPLFYGTLLDMIFLVGLNFVLMAIYTVTVTAIEHSVAADELKSDYLVVSEQERMARDVHDGVGHSLTALHLKAQLALRLIDEGQIARARTEVEALSTLALAALDSVRTTVHGMSRGDLGGELAELQRSCTDSGIALTVVGQADLVPAALRSHVAWVLREALTNVLRHAHATGVWVTLSATMVSIEDDGDGISGKEGHGIRGMRERARLFDASCTVGESSLGGTRVQIDFGGVEGR